MTQTAYREQQSWYLLKLQDQKSYSFWELSRIPFTELEQIAFIIRKTDLAKGVSLIIISQFQRQLFLQSFTKYLKQTLVFM